MSQYYYVSLSYKYISLAYCIKIKFCKAQRINTPPKAVILPSSLVVKLPNTVAVLDGSSSRDDTGIVHWRWELQKGQLGYRPHLPPDTPTLQLNDLQIPGNYTFK